MRTNGSFAQRIPNALPWSLGQSGAEPSTADRRLAITDPAKTVIEILNSGFVDLMATPQYATRGEQQHAAFILGAFEIAEGERQKSRSSEIVIVAVQFAATFSAIAKIY